MATIMPGIELKDRFAGLLLGTAVGDALGLPSEGLTADQIRRRWKGQWTMRFIFGRGMVSDDTEHTLMVAQALLSHPGDVAAFQRTLSWKFRWWFIALPGGVGLATAKACLKLWIGFSAGKCAVKSAGSGPPMRSAVLGAYFADEPERRREFVLASSRLTHRGWQAETAALAVAESVALTMMNHGRPTASELVAALLGLSPEAEWKGLLTEIEASLKAQHSVSEFACSLGLKTPYQDTRCTSFRWLSTHGCATQTIIARPLSPFWNVAVIPTRPEPSWVHWSEPVAENAQFPLNGSTPFASGHARTLSWNKSRHAWQNRNRLRMHAARFSSFGPDSSCATFSSSQSSSFTDFVGCSHRIDQPTASLSNVAKDRRGSIQFHSEGGRQSSRSESDRCKRLSTWVRPATISSNTRARRTCSARRERMTINTSAERNPNHSSPTRR